MPIRVLYEISEALAEVTMARVGDGHHVRQMGMEPPAGAVGIELQNLGRLAYAEIQARNLCSGAVRSWRWSGFTWAMVPWGVAGLRGMHTEIPLAV